MQNGVSIKGIAVWLVCAAFFTYEFLLRTVLGTFQIPIMEDLSLSSFAFAMLSTSAFLLVYSLMQIPAGLISDRYGLRRSLFIGTLLCALSCFLFSLSQSFSFAIASRMLMAMGSGFGFICLLISVYEWLPRQHYGSFIGLSQFIGTMGPMMAAGPLESMAHQSDMSWRMLFVALSCISAILCVFVLFFVRNNNGTINKFKILKKPEPFKKNLRATLFQKQIWIIALYSAFVYFALEYLSENEGKIYLELNGFSSTFSSYLLTLGWLTYAIACPILGVISDITKRRKPVLIVSSFLCLIAMVLFIYFPISKFMVILAFVLLGIGAAGQSVGFAIMAEQCSKAYLALGIAFNNSMIAIVGSVNAPLVGWLLHSNPHSQPVLQDYQFAFSFMLALIAIACLISTLVIRETFCRSTKISTIVKGSRISPALVTSG